MRRTAHTINFTAQGLPEKVVDGSKRQTIRSRERVPKPGEWLRLTVGARSKSYRVLFFAPCARVRRVRLWRSHYQIEDASVVADDGLREGFALLDGFDQSGGKLTGWEKLVRTLCKMHGVKLSEAGDDLLFEGHIIEWDFGRRVMPEDWERV